MAGDVKKAIDLLAKTPIGEIVKRNAGRFSWKKAAAAYERIYRKLQEPRRSRGD
jgi:glycogen synthase